MAQAQVLSFRDSLVFVIFVLASLKTVEGGLAGGVAQILVEGGEWSPSRSVPPVLFRFMYSDFCGM